MKKQNNLQLLKEVVFDFALPTYCLGCGQPGDVVCRECAKGLAPAVQKCIVCTRKNPLGLTCRGCQKQNVPRLAIARFAYEGLAQDLIQQYKYEDVIELRKFFAMRLASIVKKLPNYKDYKIQPMPISRAKFRLRGYNQSLLLANELSNFLGVELTDSLVRVEVSKSQVTADTKRARSANVKNVFNAKLIPPRQLILLDDVVTTGATMREAAKALYRAGAQEIICISIAC